jgi:hypothetical protein
MHTLVSAVEGKSLVRTRGGKIHDPQDHPEYFHGAAA